MHLFSKLLNKIKIILPRIKGFSRIFRNKLGKIRANLWNPWLLKNKIVQFMSVFLFQQTLNNKTNGGFHFFLNRLEHPKVCRNLHEGFQN